MIWWVIIFDISLQREAIECREKNAKLKIY